MGDPYCVECQRPVFLAGDAKNLDNDPENAPQSLRGGGGEADSANVGCLRLFWGLGHMHTKPNIP